MLINEALERSATGGDPDQWSPRDRLDHYRAENERVKLEAAQGRLVLLDDVITTRAATFKALVLGLETLPDRIEIAVGLNADQVDVMVMCIDGMREQLYTDLKAAINA